MLVDPRDGDAEDDIAAPKARSMLRIAGALLVEISPVKFVSALLALVILPGLVLGVAPILAGAWVASVSGQLAAMAGLGSGLLLAGIAGLLWLGGRKALRILETNFWSLNSVLVQPFYMLVRDGLRHLVRARGDLPSRLALRAHRASAPAAGLLCLALSAAIILAVWPATRWSGVPSDLLDPRDLVEPALANAVVIVALYAAGAALMWGAADALMPAPERATAFAPCDPALPVMRVALLSDVHTVAEPYGFRLESGRNGPRGNERLAAALGELAACHARAPVDLVIFSGDMTDAGRAGEWAAFLDLLEAHPELLARSVILPGNHDVNIVDRANPARLVAPWSDVKQLRRLRFLSAAQALQGARALVPGDTSDDALEPLGAFLASRAEALQSLAAHGGVRAAGAVREIWAACFPMVVPPSRPGGTGLVLLDSNADTHFSFTNALGLMSAEQGLRLEALLRRDPDATWLVVLHHHLVEYPGRAEALSVKLGTALINGSLLIRQLAEHGARLVALHGHRHVDWIGASGPVRIVSAPSVVMNAPDHRPSGFHIHRFQARAGRLVLCAPHWVEVGPVRPAP
jgi:3',5'-cyclic AMP phosphodiesterase CpdA